MDRLVLDWIVAHRIGWLTTAFEAITTVGGLVGLFVVAMIATVYLLTRSHQREATLIFGSMLSGWLVMSLAKLAIGRDRPPFPDRLVVESTHSFPSGHAMLSAILACTAAAVIVRLRGRPSRILVSLCALGTFLDGLSRVYLGAHWLTDVLAGWFFGVLWAVLWIRVRPYEAIVARAARR
jgi:membrane-associated phospholipid phosphatase